MSAPSSHSKRYLAEVAELANRASASSLEALAGRLARLRDRHGRLFILGVGGSAANASHAVNDFRKLCHLEAYTPTDNVSELTARTNDDGWEATFEPWLRTSRLGGDDAVMVLSVGGGSREHGVSTNLVRAVEYAREASAEIYAVVGRPGGVASELADARVLIAAPKERLTPHVEGFQSIVLHALVSHPALAAQPPKWESLKLDDT